MEIKKARPKQIRTRRNDPAVPPEFRLKANTLTACNGANRTELMAKPRRDVDPVCSKANSKTERYMSLSAKAALSVIRLIRLRTLSSHLPKQYIIKSPRCQVFF